MQFTLFNHPMLQEEITKELRDEGSFVCEMLSQPVHYIHEIKSDYFVRYLYNEAYKIL